MSEYITRQEYEKDMDELDSKIEMALKLLKEYIDLKLKEIK